MTQCDSCGSTLNSTVSLHTNKCIFCDSEAPIKNSGVLSDVAAEKEED
jgi:hypothetical protein